MRASSGKATQPAPVKYDWSKAEKRIIAAEALRIIDEDSDILPIDAIRKAVSKLSKPAQHDVKDMRSCRWIFPLWSELKEGQAQSAPTAPTEAPAVIPDENYPNLGYTQQGADVEPAAKPRASSTKGRTMVRWKDAERETIAKAYIKLRFDFPDMSETEALRKAIEYSPDVRQRKIVGYSMEKPWLAPLVEKLTAEVKREQQAEARKKEKAKQEAEAAAREQAEQAAALERAAELERAATEAIEALSLDEMMAHMARKFGRMLVAQMQEGIASVIKEAVTGQAPKDPYAGYPREVIPEAERAKPAPRDHKPRVMICGLLNQQQQEIKKEFASLFNLDFHRGTGEGGSELGASLKNFDVVIQMAGFSGHDREDKFKKYGIKPVRINGTTSAVKRWLRQWAAGTPVRMSA